MDANEFKPTDETRATLKRLSPVGNIDEFFDLWEAEGDARKAGSIVAHRHLYYAAVAAAFGATLAEQQPQLHLFLQAAESNFRRAVEAIAAEAQVGA